MQVYEIMKILFSSVRLNKTHSSGVGIGGVFISPTFASHSGELSEHLYVGHAGEMSHSPAPYTPNQTPSFEIEKKKKKTCP